MQAAAGRQLEGDNTSVLEGILDAHADAAAVRAGIGHVVRIAGDSGSKVFADDVGTPRLRMLQRLHHQHARALTHYKAIPALVPWPRGTLWVIVVR